MKQDIFFMLLVTSLVLLVFAGSTSQVQHARAHAFGLAHTHAHTHAGGLTHAHE